MDNFEITKVNSNEITSLQKVGRQTFFETFSQTNTEENMQKYLEESFSSNKLLGELNNPDSLFYFAKYSDEIVGYLKLNFGHSQTELNDNEALEIERIYVLKDFQGKKIGQKLYEKAVEVAKQNKVKYIWLGVWEKNQKAIDFYEKNGFVPFDKHIFVLGDDEQTDIMMKMEL